MMIDANGKKLSWVWDGANEWCDSCLSSEDGIVLDFGTPEITFTVPLPKTLFYSPRQMALIPMSKDRLFQCVSLALAEGGE